MQATITPGVATSGTEIRTFIDKHPCAQGVHSQSWAEVILQEIGGDLHNIVIRNPSGGIAGWMPVYVKHGPVGPVVNSSPFYGSHGGVLATSAEAFAAAAKAFVQFLRDL